MSKYAQKVEVPPESVCDVKMGKNITQRSFIKKNHFDKVSSVRTRDDVT